LTLALLGASIARRAAVNERMSDAALAFLATLDDAQRTKAALAFDGPARKDWHYVPRERPGIALGELNDAQRTAVHALLRTALGAQGYLKVTGIVHLEAILQELESTPQRRATMREPGNYALAIFGKPGVGPWAWRFEGHHLSLDFCSVDGEFTTHTPLFLGANPARVGRGPDAGWRVLATEEDVGRELYAALDADARAKALLAGDVPRDVILSPGRDASFVKPSGLEYGAMSAAQRALVEQLLHAFIDDLSPELAAAEWERVRKNGIDKIRFAWCGSTDPGKPHYWRLHGPHFVIEYDNVQDGANHVHTLWRDLERDFGGDLLKQHYERAHADSKR
jgi:hypothetical protein